MVEGIGESLLIQKIKGNVTFQVWKKLVQAERLVLVWMFENKIKA